MKNKSILIIAGLFLLFLLFYFNLNKNNNKICFSEDCFQVEIVSSQEETSKGLMFRESLEENSGMFFIFQKEGIHGFWMKNTLIPLDIIWISENLEVVHIEKNVQPCQSDPCEIYANTENALYVLELNSGIADKINLEIGNKAEIIN
jgi:uncharacterized membrane protein (UPF0127 family)